MSRTVQGDFGRSFDSTKPVSQEILAALPNTLWLVGISTVLTIGIGLWIGIRAGRRRGGSFDKVTTPMTMALYGTPEFFLGMLFLAFLGARLGWFPTGGVSDPAADYTGFAAVVDRARHLVLPVATLTLGYLGSYSLVMRTSMLDTSEDYRRRPRQGTTRPRGLRVTPYPAQLLLVSLIAIGFGFIIGVPSPPRPVLVSGTRSGDLRGDQQQRPTDAAYSPAHRDHLHIFADVVLTFDHASGWA
jgi:peptide/nickel transport system permease protein